MAWKKSKQKRTTTLEPGEEHETCCSLDGAIFDEGQEELKFLLIIDINELKLVDSLLKFINPLNHSKLNSYLFERSSRSQYLSTPMPYPSLVVFPTSHTLLSCFRSLRNTMLGRMRRGLKSRRNMRRHVIKCWYQGDEKENKNGWRGEWDVAPNFIKTLLRRLSRKDFGAEKARQTRGKVFSINSFR